MNMMDIVENITATGELVPIGEAFTMADVQNNLQTPSILPTRLDTNIRAWLKRIEIWGKIKFEWFDPDKRKKRIIDKDTFIKKLTDQDLRKMFGVWKAYELDINKIEIRRFYASQDKKANTEKFWITVDIKLK